ncbi:hypothetical protein BO79DRAFT_208524 [Aspergillus costaricaensis CBS 115574]|uniref:Uncharacterized protein n=1 Tax=Aspergillus costaricaensis CBS 115574 TaxID=1448317 RepID=A0ACD1IIX8_9EURO|nr:hypothetical protein BO79DRAFT_208524 [Aspergillus costaricaensis CBS 115574]RAK90349.1 hypothetical protein BO79DRAFT_208524 [Aspergillus costaricaensis CBS 115574]
MRALEASPLVDRTGRTQPQPASRAHYPNTPITSNRTMPIGESGLSGKWCSLVGRVHDGMAILGDGIDALSATATKRLLAILCCFG